MDGYGGFERGLEDERGLGFENEEEEEKKKFKVMGG
jgi:hypothetical protein